MWLIFAVLTAICWGLVLASVKRAYTSFSPTTFVVIGSVSAVGILLPFSLINKAQFVLWPLLPVAIIVAALFIFEFYALEKGKLSLTGTVLNMYPFFTLVFAALFLQESISFLGKAGVGVILLGLLLISLDNLQEFKNFKTKGWLLWGLAGALATGFGDFLIKAMINYFDPYSYSLTFVIGWLTISMLLLIFDKKNFKMNFSKDFVYLCLGTIFLFSGYIFLHLALQAGLVSIVTPITSSAAVISLLLAFVWLKEKIFKHQLIGALLIITGVIVVSTF
ncbi:MAG: DMT family transporter [Candidatus Woykebacteria bacterium]